MLAIIGASGQIGHATLSALLTHNLLPADQIICTTSSTSGHSKLTSLQKTHPFQIRPATWEDPSTLAPALRDCSSLFLVSSPTISKDFHEAPPGEGRERDHYAVLEAAKAAGVRHVYYTSLAFAKPSKSRVMKAHERTEEYLRSQWPGQFTVLREGLYNESWPLYFGHYDIPGDNGREEVVVAGDGKVSWTSIPDLGLANALVLSDAVERWAGRTFYLSQRRAWTLEEVAGMVGRARGKAVGLRVVDRDEHERFYTEERGMPEPMVKWWSKSYDALRDGECEIDDSTLEELLARKGMKPTSMEQTVQEMLKQ